MELNQGASYRVVILCEYMHIDGMKVENKEIVIDKNVRSDTLTKQPMVVTEISKTNLSYSCKEG